MPSERQHSLSARANAVDRRMQQAGPLDHETATLRVKMYGLTYTTSIVACTDEQLNALEEVVSELEQRYPE